MKNEDYMPKSALLLISKKMKRFERLVKENK
jgi:hypothetical protein